MFRKLIAANLAFALVQYVTYGEYDAVYSPNDTDDAGLAAETLLQTSDIAANLSYYVAEKVGTDQNSKSRYVLRTVTIDPISICEDVRRAVEYIRKGVAYKTNAHTPVSS